MALPRGVSFTTGTVHMIALSGMNISILTAVIEKITQPLGRKLSIVFTLIFITGFVLFVGPSPSIVRAAIMAGISLTATLLGRQYWPYFALGLSALIMLLFQPSLITDISFQLSFLATLGIIVAQAKSSSSWQATAGAGRQTSQPRLTVARPGSERILSDSGPDYAEATTGKQARMTNSKIIKEIRESLKENLRLTLYAQLFTAPIIFFQFGRLSLIAPVANLVVEWAVQPIMILGLLTGLLSWIWYPLGLIPAWLAWVPLTYILTAVEWLAKVPGAQIEF